MAFLSLAPFFIFSAFVLLLLVTLSAPIIHPIYLFALGADTASVHFGVFGYCLSPVTLSAFGGSTSSGGQCTSPRLGYTFDSTVANALGVGNISNLISRTTAAIFVLNPIAAGLAFLAFLTSVLMLCRSRNGTARISSFLTFGVGGIAAILATVAFVANIVIVSIVRSRARDSAGGALNMTYGNAVWMTLAAMVALWLGVGGACCGICACGGRNRTSRKHTATY